MRNDQIPPEGCEGWLRVRVFPTEKEHWLIARFPSGSEVVEHYVSAALVRPLTPKKRAKGGRK